MKLGIIATQMADGVDAGAAFAFGDSAFGDSAVGDGARPVTAAQSASPWGETTRPSAAFLRSPSPGLSLGRGAVALGARAPRKAPRRRIG